MLHLLLSFRERMLSQLALQLDYEIGICHKIFLSVPHSFPSHSFHELIYYFTNKTHSF